MEKSYTFALALLGLRKQRNAKFDMFEALPCMGLRSDVFLRLEILVLVVNLGNDGERAFWNGYRFRLQLVDGTSPVP